ncbi:MAG: serine/threonine protein kinase, partial [Myxococcales bacterium]|nr:serine/threonine protein kinase [Myxococcales bacterium]
PSIVNIFEAGTWRGEPYYVMKLVRGESLEKKLSSPDLTSRLALLPSITAVVDAVAYAHGAKVIHRDLKPENILVGEFGESVVIDWGLAKQFGARRSDPVLDDTARSEETVAGSVMGTPSYMPPEQARGEQVDARADVYSLGAILYVLLSGHRPYADSSPAQIVTAVIAGPPAQLPADAPPDLATIVGKAMARDASARYANAKELADDLKRFQTGQLVASHRYSARQLVVRWVRRHRAEVAVGSAALVVLAVTGVLGLRQILDEKQRATGAQVQAEEQRAEAEKLLNFMLGDLKEQLAPIGKVALLEKVATQAETYFDGPRAVAGDQHIRMRAMLFVGDVLVAKGNTPRALAKFQAAERIARTHLLLRPADRDWRRDAAEAIARLGSARWQQGDLLAAIAAIREQASLLSGLANEDPSDLLDRALAACHSVLGVMLSERGDTAGALAEFRAGLAVSELVIARASADSQSLRDHARLRLKIGMLLGLLGDHDGALIELRGAVAIMKNVVAAEPEAQEYRRDLGAMRAELAEGLGAKGDEAGAIEEHRAALELFRLLAKREPDQPVYQAAVASALTDVARHVKNRSNADALPYVREARAIRDRLVALDPTNASWQAEKLTSAQNMSMLLLDLDLPVEALVESRTALEIGKALVARDETNLHRQMNLEHCYAAHGAILEALGKRDEALAAHRAGLAIAEKVVAAIPTHVGMQTELADRQASIAELLWSTDRAAAETAYRAAIAVYQRLATAEPTNPEWPKIVDHLTRALAGT